MSLVVLATICVLACGFFLYVLLQWMREDGRKTVIRSAAVGESRRSSQKARLKVLNFQKNSSGEGNRPGPNPFDLRERGQSVPKVAQVAVGRLVLPSRGLQDRRSLGEHNKSSGFLNNFKEEPR